MTDMIVNLHLREMPEGDFLATLANQPDFEVRGDTAGATLEKARAEIEARQTKTRSSVTDHSRTLAGVHPRHDTNAIDGANARDTTRAGATHGEGTGVSESTIVTRSSTKTKDTVQAAASPAFGDASSANSDEEELLRQVAILNHVEQESYLSQRRLAKLMNLNLATVNQIVKRLVRKGYVKTRRLNGRSVAYYLTPQGFSEKLRLVLAYTRQTISFFATVREIVNAELARLKEEHGITSVAIVGTGELAEAAYLSAREQGLRVTAVYDKEKAGATWLGHGVTWPISKTPAVSVTKHVFVLAGMRMHREETGEEFEQDLSVHLPRLLSERMGQFARSIAREDRTEA